MSSSTTVAKPTIFREYIGSKPYPHNFDDFPDIINPEIKEFHFIIAFAAEVYHWSEKGDESRVGTGNFYGNWLVPFIDGEMIRKLKNKYNNVKVVISIGGRGSKYPFNPADKEMWIANARDSLIMIINDLKDPSGNNLIDGIDINYNTITSGDVDVFATCIGRLINCLKNEKHLVKVVSIAPSDSSVRPHYRRLYAIHEKNIDWVNYQFYTRAFAAPDAFERLYRDLATEAYTGHKLLAGFSTDPEDAGKLPRDVFIEACRVLIDKGVLPGIFIWNANDSASNQAPFQMEWHAQNLHTRN